VFVMPASRRQVRSFLAAFLLSTTGLLSSAPQARAQNDIWLPGATTWGDNASWSLGSPPGPTAIAQFQKVSNVGGNTFPFIESNRQVGQLFFTSDADAYTFLTQTPTTTLTLNNSIGILDQSSFNQIFATGVITIGAAIQTWNITQPGTSGGSVEFDTPVAGTTSTSLTKQGAGDLLFRDRLTVGTFTVQGGRAIFDNKPSAFTMSSGNIIISAGILQLGGDAAQSPTNAIDPTTVTINVGNTGTLDSGPSTTHTLGNVTLQGRILGNGTGTGANFTFNSGATVTVPTGGTQTALIDSPRGIQLTPGGGSVGFAVNTTFSNANPGSSDLTITAPISGLGSLDKSGPGILRLTAANTYSGGTNINGGVLQLTSTGSTGTGAVSVANVASLVGIGTVGGGPLTVQSGGTVSVQNPVTQAPGRLTQVNGNTDFATGTTFGVRIGGDTNTDTDRSQLNTTGSINFPSTGSGGTWTVDVSKVSTYNPTGSTTRTYTIAQASSILSNGLDTPVTLQATGAAGQTASNGTTTLRVSGFAAGSTFTLQKSGTGSIVLSFSPVPEPVGVLAVFGVGLGFTAWRRRARQLNSSIA